MVGGCTRVPASRMASAPDDRARRSSPASTGRPGSRPPSASARGHPRPRRAGEIPILAAPVGVRSDHRGLLHADSPSPSPRRAVKSRLFSSRGQDAVMTVHSPPPPVAGPPGGLRGPPAGDAPGAGPKAARRGVEWAGLAVVWIVVGWLLGVDVAGFLILGVPLAVIFQVVVRRRPLRQLWSRDTTTFARRGRGKFAVAVVLVVVAAATVAQSAGTWIDDSWTVLLLVTVLLVGYALGRRLFVALSLAALVVVAATGVLAPRLAAGRTGGPRPPGGPGGPQRTGP